MMELTREEIGAMAKCNVTCDNCKANKACMTNRETIKEMLATALLVEMDRSDIWSDAPELATSADILWFNTPSGGQASGHKRYTRELPKSRIDEIAEEAVDKYKRGAVNAGDLTNIIKAAILKDREEREANR